MGDDTWNSNDGGVSRSSAVGSATAAAVSSSSSAMARRAAAGLRPSGLVALDAVSLGKVIHRRQASCVEVMTAYLDHIDRVNPHVNAIVAVQDRTHLLAEARERDEQLARGQSFGPLHGFPHAVKDLQAVSGIRLSMGSPLFKDVVPTEDSPMVARLRRAGAIFIGKTNTPEFGLGSHTYNPVYGVTRNAYDTSRSAGGSSGGAAVGLALRMLPLADGSDYGGSLRNPAGWNAVYGFRTSIGRIPGEAHEEWLPSMGVLGPMARNVADLALLLAVQAGFDPRAPLPRARDGARIQQRLDRDFKGTRVAWGADFRGFTPCESGVLDVCARAVRTFESLGCFVDQAVPHFDLESVWQAVVPLRAWHNSMSLLSHYRDPAKRALLKPEAIFEVETGLKLSAYDVTSASIVRAKWFQAVRQFFEKYDFLILPTAQVFPFPVEEQWPREIAGHAMRTYHEWMKSVLLVTISGCPALAAPAGFNECGLPIGIQIVAPVRRELDCLRLAYAYESAADPSWRKLPTLIEQ